MAHDTAALIRTLVDMSADPGSPSEFYRLALPVLAKSIGFDNAMVVTPGIVDSHPQTHGMCPESHSLVSSFMSDFGRLGVVPTRAAALAVKREVVTDREVYADLGIDRRRDPFENEIALPCRITSVLDLAVRLGPTVSGIISLHRSGRGRPFSSRDADRVKPLTPVLGLVIEALRARCEHPAFDSLKAKLTARELQIAALVRQGLSNKEIATTLGSSPHTVRNQLHEIFDKLSISRRVELARMVGAPGLITP